MGRFVSRLLIFVMIILLFISCAKPQVSDTESSEEQSQFTGDQNQNEESGQSGTTVLEDGRVILKFGIRMDTMRSEDEYYVYYVGVKSHRRFIEEATDLSEVELVLDKGDVYLIGIAKRVDGYIKTVGVLGVPDVGLSSVPIATDSTSMIDLGELVSSGLILAPEKIDVVEFARNLGFDVKDLKALGDFDITLRKFLNLDINRNGVLDSEEGLEWWLTPLYYYSSTDGYSLDNPVISYNNGPGEGFKWFISISTTTDFKSKDFFEETAEVIATLTCFEPDGTKRVVPLDEGGMSGRNGDDSRFWTWAFYQRTDVDDPPPWNGDYLLEAEDVEGKVHKFYFDNLMFIRPSNLSEGLIFPAYEFQVFSDGKLKSLTWKWYLARGDGTFEELEPEVVSLVMKDFYFYLATSKDFHVFPNYSEAVRVVSAWNMTDQPWSPKQIDLSDRDLWVNSYNTYHFTHTFGDYNDIAGNDVKFIMKNDVLNYPHDFSPALEGFPPGSTETIVGTWMNIGYLTDGDEDTAFAVRFYKDGSMELCGDEFGVLTRGSFSIDSNDPSKMEIALEDGRHYYAILRVSRTYMEIEMSDSGYPDSVDRESGGYRIYSRYDPYLPVVENPKASLEDERVKFSWDVNDEEYFSIALYKVYYSTSKEEVENLSGDYVDVKNKSAYVDLEKGKYYWRVVVVGNDGSSIAGPIYSFEVP